MPYADSGVAADKLYREGSTDVIDAEFTVVKETGPLGRFMEDLALGTSIVFSNVSRLGAFAIKLAFPLILAAGAFLVGSATLTANPFIATRVALGLLGVGLLALNATIAKDQGAYAKTCLGLAGAGFLFAAIGTGHEAFFNSSLSTHETIFNFLKFENPPLSLN